MPSPNTILLLAFGRRAYGYAARNAITSLRFNGWGGRIVVHADDTCAPLMPDGVEVKRIQGGDPCWVKLDLTEIIDGPTLFLDADTIVINDITALVDALGADGRPFITAVEGTGTKHSKGIKHFGWATPQKVGAKEGLSDDAPLHGIQSSWMWMVPGIQLNAIGDHARAAFVRWAVRDLQYKWGGGMPDELMWTIACAHLHYDPTWKDKVMWFGHGLLEHAQVKERFLMMTLPGQRQSTAPRAIRIYDAEVRRMGAQHKAHDWIGEKYANFKQQNHALRQLRTKEIVHP